MPTRWRRGLIIVLAAMVPVAILTWPWRFLPDRWRYYSEFREAETVIDRVRDLNQKTGQYPSADDLRIETQAIEYIRLRDGFQLVLVEGLDEHFVYDSRKNAWDRLGTVDEKAIERSQHHP